MALPRNLSFDQIRSIERGPLIRAIVKEGGLRAAYEQYWPIVEPSTPFHGGWHIDAMCEFAEAMSRRQILKGIISVPPGHSKTLTISVAWPVWTWTEDPGHKFMMLNWKDANLKKAGQQTIDIMQSDLFREAWPDVFLKFRNAPETKFLFTNKGGIRHAMTLLTGATGGHYHTRVFDDPINVDNAESEAEMEAVLTAWTGGLASRQASDKPFASLGIMQRIKKNDLAGWCLDNGYEHLMLPLEYVPNAWWDYGNSLGIRDQRTEPGDLLWPAVFGPAKIAEKRKEFRKPTDWAAQMQQNPTPDTGGTVERAWIRTWSTDQSDKEHRLPPADKGRWFTSWDLGFKGETSAHSRVAGVLCFHVGVALAPGLPKQQRLYIVDGFAKHLNYADTKIVFKQKIALPLWQRASAHLIEEKANGAALLSDFSKEIFGMQAVTPEDEKGDRLLVHSDAIKAGALWLPPQTVCVQANEMADEIVFYPNGDYDDLMDVITQALDNMALHANQYGWLEKLQQGRPRPRIPGERPK